MLRKKGKGPVLRPRMTIRDTGFSRNQWCHDMIGQHGVLTSYGSTPARNATVKDQVAVYFDFLKRCGYSPVHEG